MSADYAVHGDCAVVTLVNPPVNGLGHDTRKEVVAGLERANADPAVKAIVLIGANGIFSGGADIREFNTPRATAEPTLLAMIAMLESNLKPVIAAVDGSCMGGGLELALGCHYRVAAAGARFALPEVKLGLIPGAGGTQRLPRSVGKAKAMDLILTARMMDAAEAERAGLVSRVVPDDQLLEEALAVATKIASFSTPAVMMAKEAVNRAYETTLAEGVRFERRLFHASFALADQKEGMAAFVEKRKPAFKNR
jgi:enoyl-CoA hydratase